MMSQDLEDPVQYIGKIIDDKYEIEAEIGKGGFARVFRAKHIHHRRKDAIKILQNFPDQKAIDRFEREAKLLASVKHKNIVEVFNFNVPTANSPAYIAMELLQGKSLDKYLKSKGKLPIDEAISIILQICEGVSAAHNNNIIHRDIKPANIFVLENNVDDRNSKIKLIDFGLAKPLFNSNTWKALSKTGEFLGGTFEYMSPEQFYGREKLDERTDVYSLGVTFYEILSGHSSFNPNSWEDMRNLILFGNPPSLRDEGVPAKLADIIEKAYHKDKEDRFENATQLKQAIEGWLAEITLRSFTKIIEISDLESYVIPEVFPTPQIYDYHVLRHHHNNGFSTTFLAWSSPDNCLVELESIHPDWTINDCKKAFEKYTEIALNLKHPNIKGYIRSFSLNDEKILVSNYIGSMNATRLAKENGGKLPIQYVVGIMKQVLEALRYLHSVEIIHNAISEDDIQILPNTKIQLAGFQSSRDLKDKDFYYGRELRYVNYIPPESLQIFREELPTSDIYSLGMTAYKLLTGADALDFDEKLGIEESVRRIKKVPRIPIRERALTIPTEIASVIEKAILIEPENRWQSAKEMLDALEEAHKRSMRPRNYRQKHRLMHWKKHK